MAGVVATVLLVAPLRAHHSILPFDRSHPIEIRGDVVAFQWRNPHTYIDVRVSDGKASVVWVVEADSPRMLESLGWNKASLAAGQKVVITGAPARDGSPSLLCQTVVPAGGQSLPCLPQARQ